MPAGGCAARGQLASGGKRGGGVNDAKPDLLVVSARRPGARLVVLVIAEMTWVSVRCGYFALISATTPAVRAQAGLVPLTYQYRPSRPCAGTLSPGAATWTDRFSLEKLAT